MSLTVDRTTVDRTTVDRTTVDRMTVDLASPEDRRAPSVAPRRSWASSQPFVPVAERLDEPETAVPWSQVAKRYISVTVVWDAVTAFLVAAALTVQEGPVSLLFGAGSVLVFVGLVAGMRGYARHSLGAATVEFQSSLRAAVTWALVAMALDFCLRVDVPRRLVFVGLPVLILISWLERHWHRGALHKRRLHGEAMQRALVVGDPAEAGRIAATLAVTGQHGFDPVGVCVPDPFEPPELVGLPVLGGIADVVQVAVNDGIEVVVVTSGTLSADALRRLSWALGRAGVELMVAPGLIEVAGPRLTVRPTGGLSLLDVEVEPPRLRLVIKAVYDRVAGILGIALVSPILLAAAIAVRIDSPGPAFFRQTRVGQDGTTFTMLKLRTMYVDAEARREDLLASSDGAGPLFKMRDDPRVTRVGSVLRRFSIDELPQLWNVVRGDMSLVGPRPPLVSEVAAYPDHVGRRLYVRPGLTGLWQVSGRSDLDWDSSVTLDLHYVDNWSVTMDLMIIWKTGRAVLRGSGAY